MSLQRVSNLRSLFLAWMAAGLLWLGGCQAVPAGTPAPTAPIEAATSVAMPSPTPTPTATPTATPTPSPTPTATPTPTPTATPSPTASAPAVTPTPTPLTFRWEWSEAELTRLAQEQARQQPDLPVNPDTVYVNLVPGQILVGGTAQVGFFSLNVEAVVVLTLEDGKPIPTIQTIRAGGNPVPAFLQDQLLAMAQPFLDEWTQTELNYVVERITITEETLVLEGRYR